MLTTSPALYHNTYSIDPNNARINDETSSPSAPARNKRGVADSRYLWPQNHTVTVSFVDTPEATQRLVQKCIGKFASLINLTFKFVEGNEADIRISAHKDIHGTWSKLGTAALDVPKNQPTMHIDLTTPPADLRYYILHEFGHALGLEHEHHHPDRTVQYDPANTYKLYQEHMGWSKDMTDAQVLRTVDPDYAITRPYDRKSVMHYNVTPGMTSNNDYLIPSKTLSEDDKAFLKSLYPRPRIAPANVQARRIFRKGLF